MLGMPKSFVVATMGNVAASHRQINAILELFDAKLIYSVAEA
jgi:hypothetical protein